MKMERGRYGGGFVASECALASERQWRRPTEEGLGGRTFESEEGVPSLIGRVEGHGMQHEEGDEDGACAVEDPAALLLQALHPVNEETPD